MCSTYDPSYIISFTIRIQKHPGGSESAHPRAAREVTQLRGAELSTLAPIQISSQWPRILESAIRIRNFLCPLFASEFECTVRRTSRGVARGGARRTADGAAGRKVGGT